MMEAIDFMWKHVQNQRRFILYVLIGGGAALMDVATIYVLTSVLGIYYLISPVISYPVITFVHFLLNKHFNFRNTDKRWMQQFIIFLTINLAALALTVLIMFILTGFLHLWYIASNVIAKFIVVVYSFNMHRKITFK